MVIAKREGRTLKPPEIEAFVDGYLRGDMSDALAAAFLMACAIRGLDDEETLALTRVMVASGEMLSFPSVEARLVDKHSTGGVADGVTLVFAPLAAALGLAVAKLSGRGLGHTGGTVDKLESIPGFRTSLEPAEIERQVAQIGCAIASQSQSIVPADGAIYALRDATGSVESIPLIASSVMSKKLAVASDLILLDVKAGSGAFIPAQGAADELARRCRALANAWGRPFRAAITDMSQPLGDAIGNALDVAEAIEVLRGERRGRLRDLSIAFGARALADLTGAAADQAEAAASHALDSGDALERFRRMVDAQGGDPHVVDDPASVLPRAPVVQAIVADRGGILAAVDAARIGRASGRLGAGRTTKESRIDAAVGVVFGPKIGDAMRSGEAVGDVHARDEGSAQAAAAEVLASLTLSDGAVEPPPLVHRWLE